MKLIPPTTSSAFSFLSSSPIRIGLISAAALKQRDHRQKDAPVRRNVKVFRPELLDRLADQAVVEHTAPRMARSASELFGNARSKAWSRIRSGVAIKEFEGEIFVAQKQRRTSLACGVTTVQS